MRESEKEDKEKEWDNIAMLWDLYGWLQNSAVVKRVIKENYALLQGNHFVDELQWQMEYKQVAAVISAIDSVVAITMDF